MSNTQTTEETITEEQTEVTTPKFYKVLIHNDDKTTMDFVIMLLRTVFHRTLDEAIELTMSVHCDGYGVVGIYTKEVAEEKVAESIDLALSYGFPLQTTFEED